MKKELKYLVIHCTATPEGRVVTSDDIKLWHTAPKPKGRGWSQVGYTDMIHLDGRVERLVNNNEDKWVDQWEVTNGVVGQNSCSRHIVYVGGCDKKMKPKDTRTIAQQAALQQYIQNFHAKHPDVLIRGHNDFAPKACPSFDVGLWLKEIGIN